MIRLAKKEDIPQILSLLFQVNQVHFLGRPDIFKSGVKFNSEQIEAMLDKDDAPIFVFEEDNIVKGYTMCEIKVTLDNPLIKDNRSLFIFDFCVDERYRRQGIGTKLYNHTKEFAIERKCNTLTLNVWKLNEDACKFYESMGMHVLRSILEENLVDNLIKKEELENE